MFRVRAAALARSVREMAGAFEGAVEAASAVRGGRKPSRSALVKLGIAPDAFDGSNLR